MSKIVFENVRISFPHLFAPSAVTGKYSAILLVKKNDKENLSKLKGAFDEAESKYKFKFEETCRSDGDEDTNINHKGYHVITCADHDQPVVVNRQNEVISDLDNLIYGGCYVNAVITLWCQLNPKYTRRINANLKGVQFFKDGERFTSRVSVDLDHDFQTYDDDVDLNPWDELIDVESKSQIENKQKKNKLNDDFCDDFIF